MIDSIRYTKRRLGKTYASIVVMIPSILLAMFPCISLIKPAFSGQPVIALPFRIPATLPLHSRFKSGTRLGKGKFLVASKTLNDPNFSRTVVLLIDYHRHGAIGLIINRPTEVKLSKVFPEIEGLRHRADTLYIGGPVARNQMHLLIRSEIQPKRSRRVFDNIFVSSGDTVLHQMIDNAGRGGTFRVYAGYAGWAPGQLDREISRGDWHILRANAVTIFDKPPSEIWPELILRSSGQWTRLQAPARSAWGDRDLHKTAKFRPSTFHLSIPNLKIQTYKYGTSFVIELPFQRP